MNEPKVRIFISSPSDLDHERALAREIIESLTQEYLPYFWIEPVLWEQEALTAAQSFQAGLVRPSECDIVLVMLWTRLGTPLADDPYGGMTGTEWEFVDAIDASAHAGVPGVLVYRKTLPRMVDINNAEAIAIAVAEWDRLETFFRRHFFNPDGSFRRAFRQFDSDATLRDLVETQLRKLLNRRIGAERRFAAGAVDWRGSPFRAGQPFDVADARVFTGRETETRELIARLDAMREAAPGLLLLTGPSGVGKSSLVRAGLVPHLIRPFQFAGHVACRWCVVELARQNDSIATLADALIAPAVLGERLAGFGFNDQRLAELMGSEPELAAKQIRAAIEHAERDQRKADSGSEGALHLAIILDPLDPLLEDLAASSDRTRRVAELLAALARQRGIWVIATLRSDHIALLPWLPALTGLIDEQRWYRLAPPAQARIRQVMEIPARIAGIDYEERTGRSGIGVVEALEADVSATPHWPPLLEQTLEDLYNQASVRKEAEAGNRGCLISVQDYRDIGGLTGSLIRVADTRWAPLDPGARKALPILCRALIALEGDARSRPGLREGDVKSLTRDPGCAALLNALIDARLVVVESVAETHRRVRCEPPSLSPASYFRGVLAQTREEWRARLGLKDGQDPFDTLAEVPKEADASPGGHDIDWSAYRPIARFVHPALLERWQPVRDWLAAPGNRSILILRTQISRQAHLWKRTDCNREYLLGEAGYAAAKAFAEAHGAELEPLEQELLQHSWSWIQLQRRRNRLTIGATLALLLLFGTVALYSLWDANHEARLSRQQQLLRDADIALDRGNPLMAVRLAWEAGLDLPEEATQRLARAIAGNRLLARVQPSGDSGPHWIAPAFSDDGGEVVTFSTEAGARRWLRVDGRFQSAEALSEPGMPFRTIRLAGQGQSRKVLGIGPGGVWQLPAERDRPPEWSCGLEGRVDVELDPSGRFLAVPRQMAEGQDTLCMLDLVRPGAVSWERTLPGDPIHGLAFSHDGGEIAVASRAGRVLILDRETGVQAGVLPRQGSFGRPALRVTFDQEGRRIAVATLDELVRVFDRSGRELAVLGSVNRGGRMVRIHQSSVRALAFSPDGHTLLVGDGTGQLVRWDLDDHTPDVLGEHDLGIDQISITPQIDPHLGEHLALSLSQDGTVGLWRLETGKRLAVLGQDAAISQAAFSRDGRGVMTSSARDGSARLWSVEPESGLAFRVLANDHVRDIALADQPRGKGGAGALLMATAGYDGQIDVWRYVQGKRFEPPVRYLQLEGHKDRVREIAFAPSGRWLASAGADGTARIWNLESGEGCRLEAAAKSDVCASPGSADCPDVYQVRFAPDERWLVTASSDPVQPVRIWDPISCKALPPPSLEVVRGGVRSLALTRGDAGALVLATGGNDGAINILRQAPAGTWAQLCTVEAHEGTVGAVTFSPDGRWLAAASRDGRASLIEIQGNRCGEPSYLDGDAGSLYDVQFAPDSKTLVTAAFDAKAQVWSVDGTLVVRLSAQQSRISSAGFSPDGEWIFTTSRDGTIAIWRRPTRVTARSPTPYLILDGDLGAVTRAVFDPSGQMIGAAYWDEAAVLWRLWSPDPNPPEELVAHWGEDRARLALIGEASRYLRELGGLSPQTHPDPTADVGDKTSAGGQ